MDNVQKNVIQAYQLRDIVEMFSLSDYCLKEKILDAVAGFSSFNQEMHARGHEIVSIDPLYASSYDYLKERLDAEVVLAKRLMKMRDTSACFLSDYRAGQKAQRYQAATLPFLNFRDNTFDLALYMMSASTPASRSEETLAVASLLELSRVATQLRVSFVGSELPSYIEILAEVLEHDNKVLSAVPSSVSGRMLLQIGLDNNQHMQDFQDAS